MKKNNLDARLSAIAELVPRGARLWDVGSDHGRLPAWLMAHNRVEAAVASDIAEGPLDAARVTARRFCVFDRMSFVLCDGLPPDAQAAADTFVIAGMGGGTIAQILLSAPWTRDGATLILQPMSSPEELRDALSRNGYAVQNEIYVRDVKRGYIIIVARGSTTPECLTLAERLAGRFVTDPEHIGRALYHLRNKMSGDPDNTEYIEALQLLEENYAVS